jgi:hypothetical protein
MPYKVAQQLSPSPPFRGRFLVGGHRGWRLAPVGLVAYPLNLRQTPTEILKTGNYTSISDIFSLAHPTVYGSRGLVHGPSVEGTKNLPPKAPPAPFSQYVRGGLGVKAVFGVCDFFGLAIK